MPQAKTETKNDLPIVELKNQAAWERWLAKNHERQQGVWLKFAKKAAPVTTIDHGAALETALCYGWIDAQAARYDDHYYLIRFTPRRKRSIRSQLNREHVERLIADGRMKPPGLAQVEAAKADGRWEAAYPAQSTATVPEDFQAALDGHRQAKQFFETLTGSTRYAFLFRLHNTRTAQGRAKRIADYIDRLSERKTLT